MQSWLKNLFARPRAANPPARRFRPGLEKLEDRLTPSMVNLVNPLDAIPLSSRPAMFKAARPKTSSLNMTVVSLSSTKLRLTFDQPLGKGANLPTTYRIPGLKVLGVKVSGDRKVVTLTTSPQKKSTYSVRLRGLFAKSGNPVRVSPVTFINYSALLTSSPPRVVGAASTGNRSVVVSFSEPMSDSALNPSSYAIGQANVNTEAGALRVLSVRFLDLDRRAVELSTDSQNELTYTVTAVNVTDMGGRALAPRAFLQGTVVDPTQASFRGTPPSGATLVDSDGDGLSDNEEQRGWTASFKLLNGTVVTRSVTSDPFNADTDGDSFTDAAEAALRLDPRDPDTDDDLLGDNQEFNEIFSDPANQDTDADTLDDGLEFDFFKTAPTLADSDGDQLLDGQEVLLGNRNPRVADLPSPTLEVAGIALRLDVRFVETTSAETREVESRSVQSTLEQSEKREHSNSNSVTVGSEARLTVGTEWEVEAGHPFKAGAKWKNSIEAETKTSHSWTGEWKESSASETKRAYQESLEVQEESSRGLNVERQVVGARMQATITLENASDLAYRIQNVQVTAFIQDPQDPTRFTPVATLLPDSEPADGYTLGPLVPARGPFIFSNDTVFPNMVESLMQNPRGLVFRISNYDIVDELGRNFAFTSKDVIDRTGSLVIDFGGFDSDGDGEGDLTEYHRVSTGAGRVIDTNGDGVIDGGDHRVVFDADGKQVGITLREALASVGLVHFDELTTPTDTLTPDQLRGSYSTVFDDAGVERLFRIRETAAQEGIRKAWEIITPTGIDQTVGLDDFIITTNEDVKLAFVQDLDGDRLPATLEFILGTSDSPADTDGDGVADGRDTDTDGLDDRFETLIGWRVDITARGSKPVFSSGTLADSDGDGLTDRDEALGELVDDDGNGLIDAARPHITDLDGNGEPDDGDDPDAYPEWQEVQTDPLNPDTDGDGLDDHAEINGFDITLRRSGQTINVKTDPTNPDTDRDTAADGVEAELGGNPADFTDRNDFADDDRDGLANIQEIDGWDVVVVGVSSFGKGVYGPNGNAPLPQGAASTYRITSDPKKADTDGDGLSDGEEHRLRTAPADFRSNGVLRVAGRDTDGDGLTDFQEVRGFTLRDLGVIVLNPTDADTDNDKLSDGAEAELVDVEANRWIVYLAEGDPYRAFSDPRFADTDFDRLVDGDERAQGSDPDKANTDDDRRNDFREFLLDTDPLEDDFLVTLYYTSLAIQDDWSTGDNAGDFAFDFAVRLPDSTQVNGLSSQLHHLIVDTQILTGTFQVADTTRQDVEPKLPFFGDWWDDEANLSQTGFFGISIQDNTTLMFPGLLTDAERSVTFRMTEKQRFAFEGVVVVERLFIGGAVRRHIHFGGMEGIAADGQGEHPRIGGVFEGSELATQTIQNVSFHFDLTNGEGSDGFGPSGTVHARYVVT